MTPSSLMFATPKLERDFRRFIEKDKDKEVGGFLILGFNSPIAKRQKLASLAGADYLMFIQGWIVVPNESPKPQKQWQPWDTEKIFAIADATKRSQQSVNLVHFHSHPAGSQNNPSATDIGFWTHYCKWSSCHSEAAIVSHDPLRVILYEVYIQSVGAINKSTVTKSNFYSWRIHALGKLAKDAK